MTSVRRVIDELVEVHNLRLRIARLKMEGDALASFGPAREPRRREDDDDDDDDDDDFEKVAMLANLSLRGDSDSKSGGAVCSTGRGVDPSGKRTGGAPSPELAETLRRTLDDAAQAMSKTQVERKIPLTTKVLVEHIAIVRGAVSMAYPAGLPPWDPVRAILQEDDTEERNSGTACDDHVVHASSSTGLDAPLDAAHTALWWAGKQMSRDKTLGDHVGRNDKTKIIAKLTLTSSGPPQREPAISPEEHKNMLSYYHKKNEAAKRLVENEMTGYDEGGSDSAAWANTGTLKTQFSGVNEVSLGALKGRGAVGFNGGMY